MTDRERYRTLQFHEQQRALGYLNQLSESLHRTDIDYKAILNDLAPLVDAVDQVKRAGELLAGTYTKRGRIQAPPRLTEFPVGVPGLAEGKVLQVGRGVL